ncbi:uncharacterized protein E0L32_007780 [Thyridium curvatum]|uniref:Trichothecene 3-O-acetyltransferase-like N-terminal domain-containing protein n=1 Tax=Thyridium curvatum TaxID=1093900 RepID=A0A507B2Q1_9PEZI|nr:uncharacterized protein E0L32_007780 [Thyridium curvatum]TPX11569.1 hypothetical protein E0L32_007780 [Thyridium curvatum]
MPEPTCSKDRRLLSTWNQVAPRAYIRKGYCFPYHNNTDLEALETHLSSALRQLARHFPQLSGRLSLVSKPAGHVYIDSDGPAEIPLQVVDHRATFSWTYDQLKTKGFPARAFVDKSFDLPYQLLQDKEGVPVCEVHARVIEGGLLLCIYCHHSVCDGSNMDNYIRSFADLTRDSTQALNNRHPSDIHVNLPDEVTNRSYGNPNPNTFNELINLCPEYCHLPAPTGPTQFRTQPTGIPIEDIQKTGCIFAFGLYQMKNLKGQIAVMQGAYFGEHGPSTFICLAAITFAHVTKARLNTGKDFISSSAKARPIPEKVRLQVAVNWRHRCFSDIMSSSASNTIALPITSIDTATVLAACTGDRTTATPALAAIARALNASINSVDEQFIALRTALIHAAPDPRYIGTNYDPRDPSAFYFNTWRHHGPPMAWKMPGLPEGEEGADGVAADAIRRATGEWNMMGAALLLPSARDKSDFEVLVTLDTESMALLCADPSWKTWVKRIIE